MNHYNKDLQDERRILALEYLGGECVVCGSTEDLEFDHKNPSTKKFDITTHLKGNLTKLYEELDKCQLLCSKDHTIKTSNENSLRFTKHTHGRYRKAIKQKCNCSECLDFKDDYNARRREKRTGSKEPINRGHGTNSMYTNHSCRCHACTKAHKLAYHGAVAQMAERRSEEADVGVSESPGTTVDEPK